MLVIQKGFTLAEVLITLGIVGVVASLTIPSLISKSNDQETVSKVKKIYSTLAQAHLLTTNDNGGNIASLFASGDTTYGNVAFQAYAKNFKLTQNCGANNGCGFDRTVDIYDLSGDGNNEITSNDRTKGHGILIDWTSLSFYSNNTSCSGNNCGTIYVDTNGNNAPNQIGRDIFVFDITPNAINPRGKDYSKEDLDSDCSSTGSGLSCSTKILNENAIKYTFGTDYRTT